MPTIVSSPRNVFTRGAREFGQELYRLFDAPAQSLSAEKVLAFNWLHFPIAAASTASLTFLQAQESMQSEPDDYLSLKLLAEAAVISSLGLFTNGILPVLWGGTTLVRAAQAKSWLERFQESAHAGAIIGLGYLGALAGYQYSAVAAEQDMKRLSPLLNNSALERDIVGLDKAPVGQGEKSLAKHWAQLKQDMHAFLTYTRREALLENQKRFRKSHIQEYSALNEKQLLEKLNQSLDAFHGRWHQIGLPELLLEANKEQSATIVNRFARSGRAWQNKKALNQINTFIATFKRAHSPLGRFVRMANPLAGALIAITVVAMPLSKLSHWLLRNLFPFLKATPSRWVQKPLWLPSAGGHESAGHGGGGGHSAGGAHGGGGGHGADHTTWGEYMMADPISTYMNTAHMEPDLFHSMETSVAAKHGFLAGGGHPAGGGSGH